MGGTAALAVGLIAALFAGSLWIWLLLGVRRGGLRGLFGAWAAQGSAVLFACDILRGHWIGAFVFIPLAPLAGPLMLDGLIPKGNQLAALLAPVVLPVGVLTLLLCCIPPRLRRWSPGLAALAMLAVMVPLAEITSRRAMCRTAEARGIHEFHRRSFYWSLRNAPQEFQFELHASAKSMDGDLGWSYHDMDWYDIPPTTGGDFDAPLYVCSS